MKYVRGHVNPDEVAPDLLKAWEASTKRDVRRLHHKYKLLVFPAFCVFPLFFMSCMGALAIFPAQQLWFIPGALTLAIFAPVIFVLVLNNTVNSWLAKFDSDINRLSGLLGNHMVIYGVEHRSGETLPTAASEKAAEILINYAVGVQLAELACDEPRRKQLRGEMEGLYRLFAAFRLVANFGTTENPRLHYYFLMSKPRFVEIVEGMHKKVCKKP